MINKTVYVTNETLEEMKGNSDTFNFNQRVNDLIKLGLRVEQIGEDKSTDRIIDLLNKGLSYEKKVGELTFKMCVEFLAKFYNSKSKDKIQIN